MLIYITDILSTHVVTMFFFHEHVIYIQKCNISVVNIELLDDMSCVISVHNVAISCVLIVHQLILYVSL